MKRKVEAFTKKKNALCCPPSQTALEL